MTKQEKQSLLNEQHLIVNNAEAQLKATDYIAAKIAEGKATKTEYKEKIEQRQQWRDQINAAQEEIARLESVETEDDASHLDE